MIDKIILASESPRRKEIISNVGCNFHVIPSNVNENVIRYDRGKPDEYAMNLAELKAEGISVFYPESIVLAADTIVLSDNAIYGKPNDRKQAEEMLRSLSGKCHQVITGVCIIKKDEHINLKDYMCTDVWFDCLSDEKIKKYLDTNEYLDKAGAYGIQGKGALLVKKIEGCFYNVMGLPIHLVESMLNRMGRSFFS